MKIGIANDHKGFKLKQEITEYLKKDHEIVDFGSDEEKSDYPIYAFKLSEAVSKKDVELGIVICGTGIGVSIACNKVIGIRCAKVCSKDDAYFAKNHNDANIIAISSELNDFKSIIETFINTNFSNEERHIKRIKMIDEYKNI